MIKLYDYQKPVVSKAIQQLKKFGKALIVMAPGLGKTIVAASILKAWAKSTPKRTLFLCHENRILDQTRDEFERVLNHEATYGMFHGDKRDATGCDILFASFQTMRSRKEWFNPRHFDCVIVDESHHGKASTFEEVITYFQPNDFLLGITATPDREDEHDIRDLFGKETVSIPLEMGIANGWLTPIEYRLVTDNLNTAKLREIAREVLEDRRRISIHDLNELIFIEARDDEVAQMIRSYDRKGIVFCENVDHAEHFKNFLPQSATYHSKKRKVENRATLEKFQQGGIRYILVVDKFNEGIDIPDTELVVFLRATDSRRIFLQQLGRGLRRAEGKANVVVLDFVGNCTRLQQVKDIVTAVESFGPPSPGKNPLVVSGRGFEFLFQEEQIEILNLIGRSFYPTWQEAAEAARNLGITSSKRYPAGYKRDSRLPASPEESYPDFPGWRVFFGREKLYSVWQDASVAAKTLGIKSKLQYREKHYSDPRLPFDPPYKYEDFPGWIIFLGDQKAVRILRSPIKDPYSTWQDAGTAAQALRIKSQKEYKEKRSNDPRLPSDPRDKYEDFPGWVVFLGKSGLYSTWQEASEAAQMLGIQNWKEYLTGYKRDPRLPSNPKKYPGCPAMGIFLGNRPV